VTAAGWSETSCRAVRRFWVAISRCAITAAARSKALHPFFLADRRGSYALLFEAALETLHDVCQRRLGAVPGTIAVLHTWTQTLAFHPHLHCIVTGGGRSKSRDRWIASRPGFLVSVRVLSRVFRGKLLDRFHRALQARTAGVGAPVGQRLIRQAASKEWVVYSQPPMAGPAQVLRYLARYTHRIAIGNERLVALQEGLVTFRYRDRKQGGVKKLLTLEAPAFVQRFLQHVLPRGFVRVRHFGLQANGCRTRLIARARQLLHTPASPQPDNTQRESWQDLYQRLTGRDPTRCPYCGNGTLRTVAVALAPADAHERGP
jgi:Putative transposase